MSDNPLGPSPSLGTLGNGMAPNASAGPGAPPSSKAGSGPGASPFDQVHQNFKMDQNQYKNNVKAFEVIDHVRRELDGLLDKGDIVRPEDVVQAAGRLVGHGLGAENLATLLADMPTLGGQGLASWIRMHDITVKQTEMNLAKETDLYRHKMAVSAFRSLAATHTEDKIKEMTTMGQGQGQGQAQNALSAGGPANGSGGLGQSMPQASVMSPDEGQQG